MKKMFTLATIMLCCSLLSFSQVTELWKFTATAPGNGDDDVKNGFAVSLDGKKLYVSTRGAAPNQIAIYDAETGTKTSNYLPGLTGFVAAFGGVVAVDGNGAIYANNVTIGVGGNLRVGKWLNDTDVNPETFIDVNIANGDSRVGYGMDVYVDEEGNGFLLMHQNGTTNLLYWEIEENSAKAQEPIVVTIPGVSDQYARISIVNKNTFWIDGNLLKPYYCVMTRDEDNYAAPTSITPTLFGGSRFDFVAAPGGTTEFTLGEKRYLVFAGNQHGNGIPGRNHFALLHEMAEETGVAYAGTTTDAYYLPETGGLGVLIDGAHFVAPDVYVEGGNAYIYIMGGFNGFAAYKFTPTGVGISQVQALSIQVQGGDILVPAASGQSIEIFNVLGQKVQSVVASSDVTTISGLVQGQIYIVKVAGQTTKVIL